MSTPLHRDAERETLSALFDGELQGDAARFALKRLEHDASWRAACGRWQLGGDVLRGTADAVAPTGFADRVAVALAGETSPQQQIVGSRPSFAGRATPSRRRWMGGAALAASVAVAALFVARPLSQPGEPSSPLPQIATTTPSVTDVDTGAAPVLATQAETTKLRDEVFPAADTEVAFASATLAVTDAPSRTPEQAPRSRTPPVAESAGADVPGSGSADLPTTALASSFDAAPTPMETSPDHPFLPQGEIVSRPWPRAVLPGYPTGDVFTASFGGAGSDLDASGSSSFYPFEPRMMETRPSQDAGQGETRLPNR